MRWAEHLSKLLNCIVTSNTNVDGNAAVLVSSHLWSGLVSILPQRATTIKNNKAAGPDGIPAEIFKSGGHYLQHHLQQFISCRHGYPAKYLSDGRMQT